MSSHSAAKLPKLPLIDVVIKSVSDIKRDYSQIIKDASKMNEPVFIMNHNKPEAVLMTYPFYQETLAKTLRLISELLVNLEHLENELLAKTVMERLAETDQVWLTMEEAFGEELNEENPYEKMTDEELFD